MRRRAVKRWRSDPWLLGILLLGLGLRLWHLGHWSFWTDEIASILFSRGSLGQIWGSDTHPPLYYALLHFWRLLGEQEGPLRLSSALVSLVTLPVIYRAGRLLAGPAVGRWAALLLATSPMAITYAQELRMYALLELAGALALLGLVAVVQRPGWAAGPWRDAGGRDDPGRRGAWIAYGLGALLALYSHNTGGLLPAAATLLVAACWWRRPDRRRLARRWLQVNGIVLLLWLPYLPWFLRQASRVARGFWAKTPDLPDLGGALAWIHLGADFRNTLLGPWVLAALVLLFLALLGLGIARLARQRTLLVLLLGLMLLPTAMELLAGIFKPIFVPRTLIWTALPCLLLLALGLEQLRRRRRALPLLALLLAARLLLAGVSFSEQAKADWRGMTALLVERVAPGELLLVDPYFDLPVFAFYLQRDHPGRTGFVMLQLNRWQRDFAVEMLRDWPSQRAIWFVQGVRSHLILDRPAFIREAQPCARQTESLRLQGVELDRYSLDDGC